MKLMATTAGVLTLGSVMLLGGCAASGGHGDTHSDAGDPDGWTVNRSTFDITRTYPAEFVGEWYSVFGYETPSELRVRLVVDAAGGFRIVYMDGSGQGKGESGEWHWERGREFSMEAFHPASRSFKVWVDPDAEVAMVMDEDGRAWELDNFSAGNEDEFDRVQDLRYD